MIDGLIAALLAFQEWLSEQESTLAPPAWETLRSEADATRVRVVAALDRGDAHEAETALIRFATKHGIARIRASPSSSLDGFDDPFRGPHPRGHWPRDPGHSRGNDHRSIGQPRRGEVQHARSLLDVLGRFLGKRAPNEPILTHPEVRVPLEARESTTFTLEVTARAAPASDTEGRLVLQNPRSGRIDLDVTVELLEPLVHLKSNRRCAVSKPDCAPPRARSSISPVTAEATPRECTPSSSTWTAVPSSSRTCFCPTLDRWAFSKGRSSS